MGGSVRLIIFDFDQTLSCVHVFKSLAGWAERNRKQEQGLLRVPRPFASTERGQLQRIFELNSVEPFRTEGGFARVAFGGENRVAELRRFLCSLSAGGTEMMICTKGLVGAAKKCLSDLRLLEFFSEVYGNIGGDAYGSTDYDKAVAGSEPTAEERGFLGTRESAGWRSKADLITRMLSSRRLGREQVVLVEDDAEEIRKAAPVCRTHFVRDGGGLQGEDLLALRRMVGGEGSKGRPPRQPRSASGAPLRGPTARGASPSLASRGGSPSGEGTEGRAILVAAGGALAKGRSQSGPPRGPFRSGLSRPSSREGLAERPGVMRLLRA